eukprot:1147145-Pelagomonas_calceolata.AAC.2
MDFAGCISQRVVKVRRTALLNWDKMHVKCEFDKVRRSSNNPGLITFENQELDASLHEELATSPQRSLLAQGWICTTQNFKV